MKKIDVMAIVFMVLLFSMWLLSNNPYVDAAAVGGVVAFFIGSVCSCAWLLINKKIQILKIIYCIFSGVVALVMGVSGENRLKVVNGDLDGVGCRELAQLGDGSVFLERVWKVRSPNQIEGVSDNFGASINLYVLSYKGYFIIRGDHALGMQIHRRINCGG